MGATVGKSGGTFLDSLPSQSTMHVVMLGLDSAGKTTALYRLKFDQYLNTVPTIGFNCEKVQGTVGRAKGVQFLVWDVGGQEKLRPLWRSYTRCTDGILFVVDSVDVERMEEAKMELMRTAKCPDNQGVPVLILANKQDLPGAREPKELEKLLGLHELQYPAINLMAMNSTSSSTGNIVGCTNKPATPHNEAGSGHTSGKDARIFHHQLGSSTPITVSSTSLLEKDFSAEDGQHPSGSFRHSKHSKDGKHESTPSSVATTPTSAPTNSLLARRGHSHKCESNASHQYKGWYIQPACAITGEGLQEGLEALFEMILKRRKLNKMNRKKR